MNNFYIYIYLDPRKPGKYCYNDICFLFEPIYIGKGKSKRYKENNSSRRNKYFINKISKIKQSELEPIVFKLYENLNEGYSFDLEKQLIQEIGRIDLKTGYLTNMTDGGEGTSGYKFSKMTRELLSEKKRKNYQDIKQEFEKRDYKLLTEENEYRNIYTKLNYICPKGHEGYISWGNFQQGKGCSIEGREFSSKKQRKNFLNIKNEFEKRKYKLLTEESEYKNNHQKLEYICPEGHISSITWNHFQQGEGCSFCKDRAQSEKMKGKNLKIEEEEITQIELLLKEGIFTQLKIAKILGVSQITVSRIKNNKLRK